MKFVGELTIERVSTGHFIVHNGQKLNLGFIVGIKGWWAAKTRTWTTYHDNQREAAWAVYERGSKE